MRLSAEVFAKAIGSSVERAVAFVEHFNDACEFYAVNTTTRLAALIAQLGHESGGLRYMEEIASGDAYEGRADLGNMQPGDGRRFKGHGPIQITGRYNHKRMRDLLRADGVECPDFEQNPDALTMPKWGMWSAVKYWNWKGLNALADRGDFKGITKAINGGFNGQADRERRWDIARNALSQVLPAEITTAIPKPTSKENAVPLPAFAAAALPIVANAVPELIRMFGKDGEKAEKNAKAAELVLDIAKTAAGVPNEQALVEAIQTQPQVAQVVREAIQERWFEIQEAGGGGIAGAAKRDADFAASGRRAIDSPAFIISCLLLIFPTMLLVDVFFIHPEMYGENLRTQIVTGVLMVISIVGAFWLGSSFGSRQKDETKQAGQ